MNAHIRLLYDIVYYIYNRKRWLTKFGFFLVTFVLARIVTIHYYTIFVRYTSKYRVLISDKLTSWERAVRN